MAENFLIDLIASLKKGDSKKQVKEDIKNLGDIKIPLIGTLNKSKTKSQIKQDLSALSGTVLLTGKVDNKRVAASMKQVTAQAQKQADAKPVEMSFAVKKEKLVNDIKLLAQQNSRLFKDTDMSIKYNTLLDNAEMSKNTVELSTLRTQLGSLRSELKVTGNAGLTMTDALKNGLSKVLQLFGGHGIIMQFTAQLRNAWKEAKELDSSIVSLSKVCDELADRNSFPAYIDKSISKAKELCTDVNDLLYATTEFKKLGNTLEKSEILAEYAIRLQNVGDTDIDTAISSIKTAIASFDEIGGYTDNEYEKKVEAYIDLINNLSNKFSIDAEGLANAIRISAGTLVEANTSIEQVASIISAANKYYGDPDYLANTLKIGSLRLRASKTSNEAKELEALGENIDDLAESTSKLRDEMMALTGVDIMVDDKNFKSYYQQLLDISKVYQTLDETTQANVLEKMFGKNRSAAGANILKAMSDSVGIYNEALQSAGSSEEEFSRWTESAEAATKRFGTAMTETYNNIINGETVKGLTNASTALLDFANKWGLVEASFKGFLTLGILKGITTLTVAFKNSAVQLSNYGSALEAVKKVSTYAQETRNYAKAMDALKSSCANLTDAQLKQVFANRNLSDSQLKEILQLDSLEEEQREARLSQLGLTQSTNENTAANTANAGSVVTLKGTFKGLTASIKEAWAAMSTLQKASIIFTAISTAFSVFSAVLSKHNEALEETRQANAEASKTASDNAKSLLDLKKQFDEGTTSTEDLTTALREQLRTMGYTETQIDSLISKYGNLAGAMDEATRKALEDAKTAAYTDIASASKLLENASNGGWTTDILIREAKTGIDELDNQISEILSKVATKTSQQGRAWITKDDSAEGLYEYYKALQEVSSLIQQTANDTNNKKLLDLGNFFNATMYGEVTEAIDKLSESADAYEEAIGRLHNADAQLELSDYLKTNDINSKEAFDEFVDGIKNSIQYSESYKEVLLRVANDAFPQFSSAVEKAKESASGLSGEMVSFSYDKLSDIPQKLSEVENAYKTAQDALESYNEKGYYSMEVIDSILSLEDEYINILVDENGQLQINSDSMNRLAAIKIEAAKASIYQETCEELVRIKTLDTSLAAQELALVNGTLTKSAYETAKALYEEVTAMGGANAALAGNVWDAATKKVKLLDNQLEALNKGSYNVGKSGISNSATKAVEDATKKTKDYIEAYMKFQKLSLESGRIDYNTYCNSVSNMLKSMYKDGKISAQDYHDYVGQMLEAQLDVYKKALSAVLRRYDKEIDKINDVIDGIKKQNDALEKQRDEYDSILSVVDSVYEKQIKDLEDEKALLQDKIDAINDANDALDLQYRKEQALEELRRAKTQRTKKLYNGTEFVYDTDKEALREAQKNLQDIETEELIRNLEKEQDAIDAEIEVLEKYRDLWAEITDAYDKEINKQLAIALWGKDYEKIILSNRLSDISSFKDNYVAIQNQINDNTQLIESYNQKIEYYENLKSQWAEIADIYEQSVEDQYAAMILGQNWESEVLSGRIDTLNNFRNNYVSIQQAIADAAWNSANEQIKAAQAAANAAGSAPKTSSTTTTNSKPTTTGGGSGMIRSPKSDTDKRVSWAFKYASGTDNAKKGVHLVSEHEHGDEIIVRNDKSAVVAHGEQLYPFEGGETVIKASETEKILDNTGKLISLVPVEKITLGKGENAVQFTPEELMQKWQSVMPDYASMAQIPKFEMPKFDFPSANRENGVSVSMGDIHLHEVNDADSLSKEIISRFPNKVIQKLYKN